jgi:hypothetical protein
MHTRMAIYGTLHYFHTWLNYGRNSDVEMLIMENIYSQANNDNLARLLEAQVTNKAIAFWLFHVEDHKHFHHAQISTQMQFIKFE